MNASQDRFVLPAAVLFLVLHSVSLMWISDDRNLTDSEQLCAAHGLAAFERHDLRLDPGSPPAACLLPHLVEALEPGDALDYRAAAWRGRDLQPGTTMSTAADGVALAETRRPSQAARRFERLWMLTLSLLTAAIVFGWARAAWDSRSALLALAWYSLSMPVLLIQTRLDGLPLMLMLLTASFAALWRFFDLGDVPRAITALVLFSLAAAVHPAAWALLPATIAGALVWTFASGTEDWQRAGRFSRSLLFVLLTAVVLYLGTWAGYGFQRPISPDSTYQPNWSQALPSSESGLLLRNEALKRELLPQGTIWAAASSLMAEAAAENEQVDHSVFAPFLHRSGPVANALLWLAAIVVFVRGVRRSAGIHVPAGSRVSVAGRALIVTIPVWIALAFLFTRADPIGIWAPTLAPLSVAAGGLLFPNAKSKRGSAWLYALPLLSLLWVYGFARYWGQV